MSSGGAQGRNADHFKSAEKTRGIAENRHAESGDMHMNLEEKGASCFKLCIRLLVRSPASVEMVRSGGKLVV